MNIYVTNLTYTTTEDELSQLFEPYGMVEGFVANFHLRPFAV
jgi:RNA recognition motif-containing protein